MRVLSGVVSALFIRCDYIFYFSWSNDKIIKKYHIFKIDVELKVLKGSFLTYKNFDFKIIASIINNYNIQSYIFEVYWYN